MDFEVGNAVAAGVISGAIMAAILYMGIAMLPRQMKMNLFYLLGSMMNFRGAMAYLAGAMIHAGMSIVFGLVHVALYQLFDLESSLAAWGLLYGFLHWLVVGMALGMMGVMHPLIRKGELMAPGAYALAYPKMTAMGFLMLHLTFGVLVGAFYAAL